MRIFFIIIMLLSRPSIKAQDCFYLMLSDAMDSCYNEAVKRDHAKVLVDPSYFPFEYRYLSNIQSEHLMKGFKKKSCRPRYKCNTTYISGYNAILRKDSIILIASRKRYRKGSDTQSRLFRRIDKIKTSNTIRGQYLLYVYDKDKKNKKWERKNFSKELTDKINDDNWLKSCVDIQNCIDFALNVAIKESINRELNTYIDPFYRMLVLDRILVLDNTFGCDFFYNKYGHGRAFPYFVASEYNMKKKTWQIIVISMAGAKYILTIRH